MVAVAIRRSRIPGDPNHSRGIKQSLAVERAISRSAFREIAARTNPEAPSGEPLPGSCTTLPACINAN